MFVHTHTITRKLFGLEMDGERFVVEMEMTNFRLLNPSNSALMSSVLCSVNYNCLSPLSTQQCVMHSPTHQPNSLNINTIAKNVRSFMPLCKMFHTWILKSVEYLVDVAK